MTPIQIGDREVLFETYEFARGTHKLFVFRCFWPSKLLPGKTNSFPSGGYDFRGRIEAAIEGRRNVGGTMMALALANANTESSQTALDKLQIIANQRLILVDKQTP
jgi:hypothetical protein